MPKAAAVDLRPRRLTDHPVLGIDHIEYFVRALGLYIVLHV